MPVLGQSLNLLRSILNILLTCPNSDTLLSYSNTATITLLTCREEHNVGFEEHILLDNLLEGFPKKGGMIYVPVPCKAKVL